MTYTVSLSSAISDKIATLYNTSVTSNDGTVTIVPTTIGNTVIYDLHVAQNATVGDNSITAAMLQALSVTAAKIAANCIEDSKIVLKGISNVSIADNTIGAGQMSNNAVATAVIQNAAVTGAKIAATTITESNLEALSVGTAELIALAVTSAKIASSAVTQSKLGPELLYSQEKYGVAFDVATQNIAWPIDSIPAVMRFFSIIIMVTKTVVANSTVNFLVNPGSNPVLATPYTIPAGSPPGTSFLIPGGFLAPLVNPGGTFEIDAVAPGALGGAATVIVYYTKA
jgi:hypothetical protein